MRELRLLTDEEFGKLNLKGPVPLDNGSKLYFNNGDTFIDNYVWYADVGKHYHNIIHITGTPLINNICDLCVSKGVPLRTNGNNGRYCGLDMGLRSMEGQYRQETDEDDHNFKCTYDLKVNND